MILIEDDLVILLQSMQSGFDQWIVHNTTEETT